MPPTTQNVDQEFKMGLKTDEIQSKGLRTSPFFVQTGRSACEIRTLEIFDDLLLH